MITPSPGDGSDAAWRLGRSARGQRCAREKHCYPGVNFSHTPAFSFCVRRHGVYLKLLMYMYRVGPIVAVPPQDDLFVPHILNRK